MRAMGGKTQRLRDPIHGLIVFDETNDNDMRAWRLIETREFQRLRRIHQLGVAEFVFPGATHTRFAHSIGVYHNARKLMDVVRREKGAPPKERESVVLIAALLHDVGHGPFSHAFERAREEIALSRNEAAISKHEKWSAKLIRAADGAIRNELGPELADKVAELIEADDPIDIYHAVVSSSFDADRLDYLLRDRYMTGADAGSIDEPWLIDNLTTWDIQVPQDDDEPRVVPTFVFKLKGRQAAEDFLLARYRLYSQIYLHKTTRGFEQLVSALFKHIGSEATNLETLGLEEMHPLPRFLRASERKTVQDIEIQKLADYRRLDDSVVWGAIERISYGEDAYARDLSGRLLRREPLRVIDVSAEFGHDVDAQTNAERRLDAHIEPELGVRAFRDRAPLNLYSRIGGEVTKAHKMVRVQTGDGGIREITEFPDTIISKVLMQKRNLVRYYFLTEEERHIAEKAMRGR
jgi:HD superfamily phosphohydrolase